MALSPYIAALRDRVGHDLLLLPGATAVVRRDGRWLLARGRGAATWSLLGGSVERGEDPAEALARELEEELGVGATVGDIVGAYGGADLETVYPNGDRVAWVTTVFRCRLDDADFEVDADELDAVGWFTDDEVRALPREPWIDRVLADAGDADAGGVDASPRAAG